MFKQLLTGAAAGAIGTVALNLTTYLDMTLRARPSSSVPAQTAGRLADKADIDLAPDADPGERDQVVKQRTQGAGALLGYVTGLGIGAVYGTLRSRLSLPAPVAGVLVGGAAMAGSDIPASVLGITDPTEWPASSWVSDAIPHLVYGMVTALTFDALSNPTPPTTT